MALVHLNQLKPAQAAAKAAAGSASPALQSPVVQPPLGNQGNSPDPAPSDPAPSPKATWGAFSQRLFDKLDAVERLTGAPSQAGAAPTVRPDRN